MPTVSRPLDSTSIDASCFASRTGCRCGSTITPKHSRTLLVSAAMWARATTASIRGWPGGPSCPGRRCRPGAARTTPASAHPPSLTPVDPVGGKLHRRERVVLDVSPDLLGTLDAGQPGEYVQGHVDAGRDAGRGDHVAVVHEAIVGTHLDGRVELGEQAEAAPVGLESQALGGPNRPGTGGERHDLGLVRMGMRPRAEDLPRADRVQFLDVIEEQDADPLHASHSLRVGTAMEAFTLEPGRG